MVKMEQRHLQYPYWLQWYNVLLYKKALIQHHPKALRTANLGIWANQSSRCFHTGNINGVKMRKATNQR
jgi:hypothetical protein